MNPYAYDMLEGIRKMVNSQDFEDKLMAVADENTLEFEAVLSTADGKDVGQAKVLVYINNRPKAN